LTEPEPSLTMSNMKMKLIFILLAFVLLSPVVYADDTALEQYTAALKASRDGDGEKAVKMLWAVAENYPEDPIADDALFQVGAICQLRIGDYVQAEKAYQLVLDRYPTSRNSRRAQARLDQLKEDRSGGDEPLRLFTQVMQNYQRIGPDESIRIMESLYTDHPNFNKREQVKYWIAEEYRRLKKYDMAMAAYHEVLTDFPEGKWSYFAAIAIGQTLIETRNFGEARKAFAKVADFEETNPGAKRSSELFIATTSRFIYLRNTFYGALAFVIASLIFWLLGTKWKLLTGRQLVSGAVLVSMLAPVFVAGLMYARGKSDVYRTALVMLWSAGSVLIFCNHLYLSTNAFSFGKKILLIFAGVFTAAALAFAVYYHTDLINLLYDSLQYTQGSKGI
jgi:tetratricopeptide (TPR) repeat protein